MMALLTLATYQAEWREENRTPLYSLDAFVASTVNCLDGILRHSA